LQPHFEGSVRSPLTLPKMRLGSPLEKSGIDLIPVCAGGVRNIVGKLSRRITSLLQTSPQLEVGARSYECPKSRESKPRQFWDSILGVPGKSAIRMQVRWRVTENTIWGKVVASLESGPW